MDSIVRRDAGWLGSRAA